jgi:hypothetical protein
MGKLRSISTSFWSDPFIEELTPSEKLLFVYLISNEKTNMLGIYEVSIRKISFETGIDKATVEKGFKEFERLGKIKRYGNYIVLVNYMKHQNYNTNMKKAAIDIYNLLPNQLKDNSLTVCKSNPLEGFERLLKHYGMVSKVEDEEEGEKELEGKEEEFSLFWEMYNKKTGKKNTFKKFMSLTNSEREQIKQKLPTYIKSTPEVKYRKDPYTWLNGKHWEDEIEVKAKKQSTTPYASPII